MQYFYIYAFADRQTDKIFIEEMLIDQMNNYKKESGSYRK